MKGRISRGVFRRLQAAFPDTEWEEHFSFARHTSIGCGGEAALAASPSCAQECVTVLSFLEKRRIPYRFLGAGANTLPSDKNFGGVVVRFRRMKKIVLLGERAFVGAGVSGGALCRYMRAREFCGFEPLTGIPMSVGGAIVMNAGVSEGHISDCLEYVFAIANGEPIKIPKESCAFGEKESVFQQGIAVTGAVFRLKKGKREEIERKTAFFREKRRSLPKGRSMGCVFVNPEGLSAGRLIDECGLKGLSFGGARVSREHANFIINEGGSSQDISRLIETVKLTVKIRTGIGLREEIRRIP